MPRTTLRHNWLRRRERTNGRKMLARMPSTAGRKWLIRARTCDTRRRWRSLRASACIQIGWWDLSMWVGRGGRSTSSACDCDRRECSLCWYCIWTCRPGCCQRGACREGRRRQISGRRILTTDSILHVVPPGTRNATSIAAAK